MAGWRVRRRRRVRQRPFPEAWGGTLECSVPIVARLPRVDREELNGWIHVLLDEKRFEGAAGLEMTERIRLIIAAQAAVLLLHRTSDVYPKLRSIIVYPGEYAVREEIETEDGFLERLDEARAGESWGTGALVLGWEEVERDLVSDCQSVVLHEFAHQFDAESGELNGAPVLADRELQRRWPEVMAAAYQRLADAAKREEETVLDPYGADDPAEFFAVAVEAFFLMPAALERAEPALYGLLRSFFRQDPARW